MILGRTPEGLIKIKKDDPLGLRAVNCACCVTAQCGCSPVSAELKSTIESATQIEINGISPGQTVFIVAAWNGSVFDYRGQDHPPPEPYANILVTYSEGILCVIYEDEATDSVFFLPEPLTAEDCSPGFPAGITTININGNHIRSSYLFADNIDLTITFS